MQWLEKTPVFGDIVRTKVTFYYHYGIYVSDERIIQFGLPDSVTQNAADVSVLESDIQTFARGGDVETGVPDKSERAQMRSADEAVRIAEGMLGSKGYDILHNNCEHFVNFCVFGESRSCFLDNFVPNLKKKLGKK